MFRVPGEGGLPAGGGGGGKGVYKKRGGVRAKHRIIARSIPRMQ